MVSVRGDGACFFHAILASNPALMAKYPTALTLRAATCDYMHLHGQVDRADPSVFTELLEAYTHLWGTERPYIDYIRALRDPAHYADPIT